MLVSTRSGNLFLIPLRIIQLQATITLVVKNGGQEVQVVPGSC